ncbi:MAG: hypothetical protein ABIP13_01310 [Tepidiformaceae bacterium]
MKIRKYTRWALLSAAALLAMVALAACGDDDDSSGGGNVIGGGSGGDEAYVADICKATQKFSDDISALTKDPTKLKDPNDIGALFAGPFETFAKSVSKAKPPSDLKDYHSQVVKTLNDASKQIKESKDLSALSALGDSAIPEPPTAAKDRIQKVAEKNKDCNDSGLFGQ